MLSCRSVCAGLLALLPMIAGCTVEPLNAARSNSALVSGNVAAGVSDILKATDVDPVNDRTAQQVRNRLLFAMNGGELQEGGQYRVALDVRTFTRTLSIESNSLAPTSAQVSVRASYELVDKSNGQVVAFGRRQSLAAYDRTPQSLSNKRAQRDAQNRAAQEIAELLRLAIAQDIAQL
ncbi:MAG: LPS assembly lipoprotein LptE [Ahrensia sp.]|nr:LPS assembly lipoprotein LptE [Ahrensia sp.]